MLLLHLQNTLYSVLQKNSIANVAKKKLHHTKEKWLDSFIIAWRQMLKLFAKLLLWHSGDKRVMIALAMG